MTSIPALDLLILATAFVHVLLAPYTKVEESFSLHATHDILMYGVGADHLLKYDHFTFPGAVPRTFVGPLFLAWLSKPVIILANELGFVTSKFHLQIFVRLTLATLNALGLCLITRAVSRRFGYQASVFFVLFTCSQFHLPFWMSRTLPNMFALFPVNVATANLINPTKHTKRAHKIAIALLTFTAVVFRAEVAILLAPLTFQVLATRKLSLSELVWVGLSSAIFAIALTTAVDSYFWQTFPLWPELQGLYFNVLQGKSSEWGVSPPLTYFNIFLPKLLLGSLLLSPIGAIVDLRITSLLFPSISFIALISCLAHKEWRFIVYIVPIFNVAAARGASFLWNCKPAFLRRMFTLAVSCLIVTNSLITIIFTLSSTWNYPGGEAIALLHELYRPLHLPTPHVHLCNLAAQTGASLYLHLNSPPYPTPNLLFKHPTIGGTAAWTYNKSENLEDNAIARSPQITHIIMERPPTPVILESFIPVANITAFDRWPLGKDTLQEWGLGFIRNPSEALKMMKLMKVRGSTKLWMLERYSGQ